MSKSNAGSPDSDVLKLFTTDNCPFAHRFWIAALEKEDDPKNPKNFEHNEVNYFNYDLPTTRDFLAVHNTVPAGVWKGKPQRESMPMVAWADETFKTGNKLRASEEPTKAAIAKFTSGEFDTVGALFKIIMGQPTDENKAKLFAAYQELGRTVKASGGPYILGKDFTAADIAVYPFVERAKLYLPHFSKVDFPSGAEYADFLAWVSAVEARPSISITRADRLPRSMETHPFAEQKRDAYLIECAEYMPYGVKENFRKQLRFAPPGKKTKDLAKAQEQKKQEDDAIARVDSGKGSAADLLYAHVSRLYAGADKYIRCWPTMPCGRRPSRAPSDAPPCTRARPTSASSCSTARRRWRTSDSTPCVSRRSATTRQWRS